MPRAAGTSTGPFNPNDFNMRNGGITRGASTTYNFVRGSQGWISCAVVVFDEEVDLDQWWTQMKFRGTVFSGQEVGTAGYARGDGGIINLEVFPIQANGLPSFTSTGTRLAKQLALDPETDLWDPQTGSFGGGDGPQVVMFEPRDDSAAIVTFQPDTPYGFCIYNSSSTPGANFSSVNRPNTRDLFWGPNTPPLGGTAWPAAQQGTGGRFRPPHHVITLDKNAPGAIAGLDPRERWMASYDGGTTWRVGLNANYYSGAADPSNDGVGLPLYMYKKNGVAGLKRGQPFYLSKGTSGLSAAAQTFTAVTAQTVTHLGCYSPNAVSSITITYNGVTRTATGGSLGTSGGQAGALNASIAIPQGGSYTITPSAPVFVVDTDANTALLGLNTTTNDERAVFAYPNPQFLTVGTPSGGPPTSTLFSDLNGGASLTGSGLTTGQASIIPSLPNDATAVTMGAGVVANNTLHAYDGVKPFTVIMTAEMASGTGRVFQKLANPDTGTEAGYVAYKDGTGLAFARVVNGSYNVTRDNSAPTTAALYHFVYDGSNLRIYRNGVAQGTATADTRPIPTFPMTGAPFVIGGKADASDMLSGKRHYPTVVPNALSQSTITAHYTAWQGTVQTGLLQYNPDREQVRWSASPRVGPIPTGGLTLTANNSDEDLFLQAPSNNTAAITGSVNLTGFRHIRLIGARFTGTTIGNDPGQSNVALNIDYMGSLNDTDTPTVYLEGVCFDMKAQNYQDCIWFGGNNAAPIANASQWPRPILYLQYCRFEGANDDGAYHSDWVQKNRPEGGVRTDMVSGTFQWQGFFLPPQEGSDGSHGGQWFQGGTPFNVFNRTNLHARANRGGYGLWLNFDVNGGTAFNTPTPMSATTLNNVWVDGASGETLNNLAFPTTSTGTSANGYPFNISMIIAAGGATATWPAAANITGTLNRGTPPGGDFVPSSFTGLGYVSPGYQS